MYAGLLAIGISLVLLCLPGTILQNIGRGGEVETLAKTIAQTGSVRQAEAEAKKTRAAGEKDKADRLQKEEKKDAKASQQAEKLVARNGKLKNLGLVSLAMLAGLL